MPALHVTMMEARKVMIMVMEARKVMIMVIMAAQIVTWPFQAVHLRRRRGDVAEHRTRHGVADRM